MHGASAAFVENDYMKRMATKITAEARDDILIVPLLDLLVALDIFEETRLTSTLKLPLSKNFIETSINARPCLDDSS